jgi:phage-related minor tail protein
VIEYVDKLDEIRKKLVELKALETKDERAEEEAERLKAEAKAIADAAKEHEQYLDDQANAYRRLYDDIGVYSESSYKNKMLLLDKEKQSYEKFITDKTLLDEWYAQRKGEIDAQIAIASDDFFEGFGASVDRMTYDMTNWGDVGSTVAQTMKSEFTNALWEMTSAGGDWKDAMEGFGIDLLMSFQKVLTQMIAMQAIAFAFGAGAPAKTGTAPSMDEFIGTIGAKGLVLSHGNLTPFAKGTILSGPTIFPMSNGGLGLAGEAGKEGVFPLTRDSQGRLGVHAEGGEEKQPIKIINVMDQSQIAEYLDSADGERQVVNIMRRNSNEIEA